MLFELVEMQYTVKVYVKCDESIAFMNWFKNVFSVNNPGAAGDFEFEEKEFEGEIFIDVLQQNPQFSIDALECIFEARTQNAEKNLIPFKPGLN